MKRTSLALLLPLLVTVGSRTASASVANSEAMVTVRIYNYAGVNSAELSRARETADRIFRNARIALRWIDCRIPGIDSGSACTDPLSEGREFMLRLMAGETPSPIQRTTSLGESVLDRSLHSGVLMTVDPEITRTIARKAQSDGATLLGRAIAHELGHLLLGAAEHPRSGLMRAFWSAEEISGLKPVDWQFSGRQAAQMRQGLLAKARAAN